MTNIALFNNMTARYHALSAAHDYLMGFRFDGNIYMVMMSESEVNNVICLDKASRGAGYALRFKPNKSQKLYMLSLGASVLSSAKFFDETVANSQFNKGEIFEKMVTEAYGQRWCKDSVPFYMQGDINIDGIEVQIKFESATFTNEKLLAKFEARA